MTAPAPIRRLGVVAVLAFPFPACRSPEAPMPQSANAAIESLAVTARSLKVSGEIGRAGLLMAYTWHPHHLCAPQPHLPDIALYAIAHTEPEAALVRACYGDTFSHATSYRPLAIGARLLGPEDDAARLRTMAFLGTWPNVQLPNGQTTDLRFETVLGGGTWSFPGAAQLAPSAVGVADFPDYVYSPGIAEPGPPGAALELVDSGWYLACTGDRGWHGSAVLRCDSGRCDYEGTGAPALLPVSFESEASPECVAATDADRPAPVNTLVAALEKRWSPPAEAAAP